MTDVQNWPSLIERKSIPIGYYTEDYTRELGEPRHKWTEDPSQLTSYAVVPLSEYQLGNLLGLLKRSRDKDNGDWFWELFGIIVAACKKLNITELRSNFGDVFDMTGDVMAQMETAK